MGLRAMSTRVPDATIVRIHLRLELDVDVARWRETHGWPETVGPEGANRIRKTVRDGILAGVNSAPSVANGTITVKEGRPG